MATHPTRVNQKPSPPSDVDIGLLQAMDSSELSDMLAAVEAIVSLQAQF